MKSTLFEFNENFPLKEMEERGQGASILTIRNERVLVIDGFFKDPEKIIEYAWSSSFDTQMGYYPGKHHFSPHSILPLLDWLNKMNRMQGSPLEGLFPEALTPQDDKYGCYAFGIVKLKQDELTIAHSHPHSDHFCDFSLLVYLYEDDDINGGTSFHRFIPSDEIYGPITSKHVAMAPDGDRRRGYNAAGRTIWDEIAYIPARVNRLVIFPGNLFHSQVLHGDPRDASDPKARVTMNSHMVATLTE